MRQTIDSIGKNIYACNQDRGLTPYTIASLYLVDTVTNPRTTERAARISPEQSFLLDADAYAPGRTTPLPAAPT
jgi:hypothetical protein